jgi:hypothetical protein
MTSAIGDLVTEIRDAVIDHPMRAHLESVGMYSEICGAMDAISDKTGSEQLAAVNVLAGWTGLPELKEGDDVGEALMQVKERLREQQKSGLYGQHIKNPVSGIFPADTGYMVEKVAGATGGDSDRALAEAAVATLRPRIEEFRTALNTRGLYGDDMTDDALYIIGRTSQFLSHSPNQPPAKDLDMMMWRLTHQVREMQETATEVDGDDKEKAGQ